MTKGSYLRVGMITLPQAKCLTGRKNLHVAFLLRRFPNCLSALNESEESGSENVNTQALTVIVVTFTSAVFLAVLLERGIVSLSFGVLLLRHENIVNQYSKISMCSISRGRPEIIEVTDEK